MRILTLVLTLSVVGFATQQRAPISADEVTLRHRIYGDGRVTIFLLGIPPGHLPTQSGVPDESRDVKYDVRAHLLSADSVGAIGAELRRKLT